MNRELEIQRACYLVWRNCPSGPTTFSACPNGCENQFGRGSGPCIKCAEKALAGLVGANLAHEYVDTVKHTRDLEGRMLE